MSGVQRKARRLLTDLTPAERARLDQALRDADVSHADLVTRFDLQRTAVRLAAEEIGQPGQRAVRRWETYRLVVAKVRRGCDLCDRPIEPGDKVRRCGPFAAHASCVDKREGRSAA